MQRLSKMVGWGAFGFAVLVLLVGPTEFIINNTINSIGLTTQNFLQMSLFTDPMGMAASPAVGRSFIGYGGFHIPRCCDVCDAGFTWSQTQRGYMGFAAGQFVGLLVLLWDTGKLRDTTVY